MDRVSQLAVMAAGGSQSAAVHGPTRQGPAVERRHSLIDGHWLSVRDGDNRARALYRRHYTATRRARLPGLHGNLTKFAGPGERLILLTVGGDALFVWRKERYRQDAQTGVNCAVFRNEGRVQSSDLIREAAELAWQRWPGERLFTFVNARKVRSSNPGYCFIKAGWARLPTLTMGGLVILERLHSPVNADPGSGRALALGPQYEQACRSEPGSVGTGL